MNINSMFFIALFCFSVLMVNSEMFIDYGTEGEGKQLFKYFHGVKNGFYVDLGAYDPIFASHTLNLYVQGWRGVNVEPNPERLNRFFLERPNQINLNVAVGEEDEFVTLYQLTTDDSSTISTKVKDYVKGFTTVEKEIKITALTLKQICERFFYRKPNFMNINVAGYGSRVLQTNDWTNKKCIPEVIFSEMTEEVKRSEFPLPQTILYKNGYQKVGLVGVNEIYVHKSVRDELNKKVSESEVKLQKMNIVIPYQVTSIIGKYLNANPELAKHYQRQQGDLVYYFTRVNEPVELEKINRENNLLNKKQLNRPIIVLHFDPRSNYLLLESANFTMHKISLGPYIFWELNVTVRNSTHVRVLVLDHLFEPATEITILNLDEAIEQLQNKKVQLENMSSEHMISSQESEHYQQVIKKIQTELSKNKQQLSKASQKCSFRLQSLQDSLAATKNIDSQLLNAILDKLTEVQSTIQSELKERSQQKKLQIATSLQTEILSISSFQLITLATAFLMGFLLCITICVKKQKQHLQTVENLPTVQNIKTEQTKIQME